MIDRRPAKPQAHTSYAYFHFSQSLISFWNKKGVFITSIFSPEISKVNYTISVWAIAFEAHYNQSVSPTNTLITICTLNNRNFLVLECRAS